MKQVFSIIIIFLAFILRSQAQGSPEMYLDFGDNWYREKKFDKAIEQYDKAIELKPDFVLAYLNKGAALESLRMFPQAIDNYNSLLKIIPDEAKVITRRGIALFKLQKYDEGIVDLSKANTLDPYNPLILSNLGLCKVRANDSTGMNELFRAILIDSTNESYFYNRGLGFLILGYDPLALDDFVKAIHLDPGFGEAYFSIGVIYFRNKHKMEGCAYWRLAVENGYTRAQPFIDQNCRERH